MQSHFLKSGRSQKFPLLLLDSYSFFFFFLMSCVIYCLSELYDLIKPILGAHECVKINNQENFFKPELVQKNSLWILKSSSVRRSSKFLDILKEHLSYCSSYEHLMIFINDQRKQSFDTQTKTSPHQPGSADIFFELQGLNVSSMLINQDQINLFQPLINTFLDQQCKKAPSSLFRQEQNWQAHKNFYIKLVRQRFLRLGKKNLLQEKLFFLQEYLTYRQESQKFKDDAQNLLLYYEVSRILVHDSMILQDVQSYTQVQSELYDQIGPLGAKVFASIAHKFVLDELSKWSFMSESNNVSFELKIAQCVHLFFEIASGSFDQSQSGYTCAKNLILKKSHFFTEQIVTDFLRFYDLHACELFEILQAVGTNLASNSEHNDTSVLVANR